MAKALQEFDLALRGKKKRKKFVQDTQKKAQMTVSSFVDKWDPGWTISFPIAKLPHHRNFYFNTFQPEERSQFEILKSQMYAERLAKRNRRAKRARALPEEEPAAAPAGRDFCFTANLLYVTHFARNS